MKTYAIFDNSFFQKKPWYLPEKLYRAVCNRSNPRSKDYMLALLHENFPTAKLIDQDQISSPGNIILLYPDSIGLGWKKVERLLKNQTNITVLNGRRRVFNLTSSIRKKLLLHRFFEITFIPEILLTPFLLFYGVIIAIKDTCKDYKP